MINLEPGPVFAWATGLLIVALAILVLAARPKRGANRAFFLFTLGSGGQAVWFNMQVGQASYFEPFFWSVYGLCTASLAIGAVWLARSSLIGRDGISTRRFWTPFGVCTAIMLPIILGAFTDPLSAGASLNVQDDQVLGWSLALAVFALSVAATAGLGCVAALRARMDPHQAASMAAITIGALVWPAIFSSFWLSLDVPLYGWLILILVLVAAGWWLFHVRGTAAAYARNVALVPLTLALVGYLLTIRFSDPLAMVNAGYFGLGRLLMGGVIAFAIVRHQILGFDIKVRRGIKGSTLAALFFAVFFVASETTAEILGDTEAGPFVGIAVAGVLVFFLAPLQRWADRLAGAATGDAKPAQQQSMQEKESTYLQMAKAAWADGSLSKDERQLLDRLAAELSLTDESVRRIESEAAT